MKCVVISDTHGMHHSILVPPGDVLIHAGDLLARGKMDEVTEFNEWLAFQPHPHKLVIAGNHDWAFERQKDEAVKRLTNAVYLEDEACTIDGVKFYGSPWQPEFFNWAFNLERGKALAEKWAMIDADTDVLITHGPPHGILDQVQEGEHVGCEALLERVTAVAPAYHVFGHIHEGYGELKQAGTTFINASINTHKYRPENFAKVFEV